MRISIINTKKKPYASSDGIPTYKTQDKDMNGLIDRHIHCPLLKRSLSSLLLKSKDMNKQRKQLTWTDRQTLELLQHYRDCHGTEA